MWVYLYPNNTETELKNAYIWIPNPDSITLDKSFINLTTVWQTEQITATVLPSLSDHSVTWSSDDTTVATVDQTWLVTCVTPWSCTITATTVNNLTATCRVSAMSVEVYDFPNGTYPWWTLYSWSFGQGISSDWLTVWRNNTNCRIYRSFNKNTYAIQHRFLVNLTSRWGSAKLYLTDSNSNDLIWYYFWLTKATSNTSFCASFNGTNVSAKYILSNNTIYIAEIAYDGTTYSINLYDDDNGNPWTLLYSQTDAWPYSPAELWLYNEFWTTPFSQNNWVKVWY